MNQWQSCLANESKIQSILWLQEFNQQSAHSLSSIRKVMSRSSFFGKAWAKLRTNSMWHPVGHSRFQLASSLFFCLITSSWSSASKKVDLWAHVWKSFKDQTLAMSSQPWNPRSFESFVKPLSGGGDCLFEVVLDVVFVHQIEIVAASPHVDTQPQPWLDSGCRQPANGQIHGKPACWIDPASWLPCILASQQADWQHFLVIRLSSPGHGSRTWKTTSYSGKVFRM